MNDDLNAWSRIARTVDEERRARIAGVLSVVAICMLLITSVTVAHRGVTFAAPPAVSSSAFPPTQPAVPASMPEAVPVYETKYALTRLSFPIQCNGRQRKGGWIEHDGDTTRTGRKCL